MCEKKAIERIDTIRSLLIEHNLKSFKLDSNENIKRVKKTDFIINILHYLISEYDIEKLFFSKKKNKIVSISPIKLLNFIIQKLPKSRGAHPYIFFLFHNELKENYGIDYKYLEYIDTFELRSKNIKIREQIQESFKIVERILTDDEIEFFPCIYNSFLSGNGINIEDKIKTGLNKAKHRFIDLTFQTSKNSKVYLEINEQHHIKELDMERAVEIYIKNNTHPIMLYKEEIDLDDIMDKVWREIAFSLFSENKKEALTIYLTKINKVNLNLSKFFIDIQIDFIEKNKGVPIIDIKKFIEDRLKFKNFYSFVQKMLESNDLIEEEHFIKLDQDNIENSILNKYGYDTILMLPRDKDWDIAKKMKNSFSDFKSNYLSLVGDLMSNQFDRLSLLKEAVITYKKYSDFTNTSYHFIEETMNKNSDLIKDRLDIKIHPKIWCIKFKKGARVPYYELHKFYSNEMVEFIRSNNENKQNIINYEILSDQELKSIIGTIYSRAEQQNQENLDSEIDNLDSEIDNLDSDIDNLDSDIDNLEEELDF